MCGSEGGRVRRIPLVANTVLAFLKMTADSADLDLYVVATAYRDRQYDHDAGQDEDRQVPLHPSWRHSHPDALPWLHSGDRLSDPTFLREISSRVCGAATESGRRQFLRGVWRLPVASDSQRRKVSGPAGWYTPTGPDHQPGSRRPGQWLQSHITRTAAPPNGRTMGARTMTTL